MGKFEMLDLLIQENNGFLKTSDAVKAGISRSYLSTFIMIHTSRQLKALEGYAKSH